jgi:primosomal protein N' (replication factor Y)
MKGFGTEKIEEEIPLFLPEAKVARMDFDTMRSKHAYQRIISDFEEGRIDILVGTQMVTKGLDFGNVSLVGIMNADNMLSFPDFRAFERSFQLMEQVSGRAGRKQKRGKVIIQTYNPYHSVIQFVINHDYNGLFNSQLYDRKNFNYPPYFRLIQILLKHKDQDLLNHAAIRLTNTLRRVLKHRVLGPEFPLVSRINEYYIKQIMVKVERTADLNANKNLISACLTDFRKSQDFRSVRVIVDVDPY